MNVNLVDVSIVLENEILNRLTNYEDDLIDLLGTESLEEVKRYHDQTISCIKFFNEHTNSLGNYDVEKYENLFKTVVSNLIL